MTIFFYLKKVIKNKSHYVDPAFRLMRFPLDGELDFYLKIWFFIDYLKMTWSRHLFLFYFLKGKQNKKEKP